jgi:hypothetical protein
MKSILIKFTKYFAWGLLFTILVTYAFGWIDLLNNNMLTGNWSTDFTKSLSYYVGWVIPYWWLMNLIVALVISCVVVGVEYGVRKFRT